MITVTNTIKVNKYPRIKGKCCSQEVHSSRTHNKNAFPFKKLPLWNLESLLVFKLAERGEFAPEFRMLSKFSLVFLSTTASSKVVNHASTVNVFSCKNSQFELPHNFISQIDRGSVALSLEYHFSNESHVPGRDFRRWKTAKLMVAIIPI